MFFYSSHQACICQFLYLTVFLLFLNYQSCIRLLWYPVMYLTVLRFYTQYKVTSHVFDCLIHATSVMYLTVWSMPHQSCIWLCSYSFLNISHVFDSFEFQTCICFLHILIHLSSVKYLTALKMNQSCIWLFFHSIWVFFNWSWYKSCIWLFSIYHDIRLQIRCNLYNKSYFIDVL